MANPADPADRALSGSSAAADHGRTDAIETDGMVVRKAPNRLAGLSSLPSAVAIAAAVVVALGSLAGWLGYRTYETRQTQAQRNLWIAVARQGALNLTTIDYTQVDADVQRILDCGTGTFRDDFQQRSQPFVEVVKKVQSKSQGTITEAGLESQQGDQAQVLVTVWKQNIECRCARTRPTEVADADRRPESRRCSERYPLLSSCHDGK